MPIHDDHFLLVIQAKTANHRELVDDDEDIDSIVGGFTAKFGNYPFQVG